MYGERRKMKTVVQGAGLTALNFAHYLFETEPEDSVELIIYERNRDVGGVVGALAGRHHMQGG